jgi:outer membrane protein TolC
MKYFLMLVLVTSALSQAVGQEDSVIVPESETLDLQFLVSEALMNNPEIQAAQYQMDVMDAKASQAGTLDDPELQFMREDMPGFRYNEAMYSRIELMQMFRFPTKLSTESELGRIRAEHAHHDHLEKINKIVATLKSAYYELWLVQQNTVLDNENLRLMKQFSQIAGTKYATGQVPQQDVLKAQVETAMINNELLALHQQEISTKAMLMAILNREQKDTLGFAVIPEEVIFTPSLDSLEHLAFSTRPMLIHDSLSVQESKTMLSLAKQEYLPDFKLGIERVTSPVDGFNGWSLRAGITLPFAPWTLGKANARVEEANAEINRATAVYNGSRNMIRSNIRDKYYKAVAAKQQLDSFRLLIVPQARQSLNASLTAYQTGTTNFLMLIDAYRTLVNMTKEYFMTRMQFEQTVAELEHEVGYQNVATLQ